jgi:alanine-glyoxylate transaminase / serine-glyoxylate transaminase / serine-pyruvate transaminase
MIRNNQTRETIVPKRLLLGPGPSEVDPEVLRALIMPPLGHLDPVLLEMMGDLQQQLRDAFRTKNNVTLALSGTGTSGMEAALCNTIEPGDDVLVAVIGYFGERLCEIAARVGGKVHRVEAEWGTMLTPERIMEEIQRVRPRVACVVHAETSTGVRQELEGVGKVARDANALLIVDAVTSLGGQTLEVDAWKIDVCYSGSQKCLGAPSGLSPITFGERALERIKERRTPVQSFYLDALLLAKYWQDRQYHHTISAPLIYSLHQAMTLLHAEGLKARWQRHRLNHEAFRAGVEAMGMQILPEESFSLWPLNAVRVPVGLDELAIRQALLNNHGIEVGGGLGPLKGTLLRVGLMGYGSQQEYVLQLLAALETVLREMRYKVEAGTGLQAAMHIYAGEPLTVQ